MPPLPPSSCAQPRPLPPPSRSRLLTAEADKTIKIWKEEADVSPESHPIDMEGWSQFVRAHKRY